MSLKISQLTEATTAAPSDVLPVVAGGASKKITVQNLRAALGVPREYTARIVQSGANAPIVVNLITNTTGTTATLARTSEGLYTLNFAAAVLSDTAKCYVQFGSNEDLNSFALVNGQITDGNTVTFSTIDISQFAPMDNFLNAVISVKIHL